MLQALHQGLGFACCQLVRGHLLCTLFVLLEHHDLLGERIQLFIGEPSCGDCRGLLCCCCWLLGPHSGCCCCCSSSCRLQLCSCLLLPLQCQELRLTLLCLLLCISSSYKSVLRTRLLALQQLLNIQRQATPSSKELKLLLLLLQQQLVQCRVVHHSLLLQHHILAIGQAQLHQPRKPCQVGRLLLARCSQIWRLHAAWWGGVFRPVVGLC